MTLKAAGSICLFAPPTVNYIIDDTSAARFGCRHMEVNQTIERANLDLGFSGCILGMSSRFLQSSSLPVNC